jgi:hypothetical protein
MGFFMAVGPLVGGVVSLAGVMILGSIFDTRSNLGIADTITATAFAFPFAIFFSYLFGLLPAALAGVMVGAAKVRYGSVPWAIVLLIGALAGIADAVIGRALLNLLSEPGVQSGSSNISFAVINSIIATFICWGFVRNWFLPERSGS